MTLRTGRDGFLFKRNDCRNDSIRKQKKRQMAEQDMKRKECLHTGCPQTGQRGWAKGFCCVHAHSQNLINPRKEKHHKKLPVKKAKKLKKLKKLNSKKLKVKDVMRKLKLNLKLKLKKATSQFPPGGQTPEKLINAKKQKKLTTNEKELTKEEVEAKNLEIRLLKPVEGFAKAAMDSDTEAEFFRAPAGDIRRLEEPQAEWTDSDDEWECGRWMVCRRRGLDDLEQLNLDLCEEDFQKLRKPEPLVPAWQWFDNETEQLDCALDLDQAIDKYNSTTINDIGWKADRISDVNVPDRLCHAAHENYLSGQSLDTRLFQGQSWDTYFE